MILIRDSEDISWVNALRMKVLALSTWFPYPPDNGSKLRAYHLIESLSQRHQVSVVAFQASKSGSGHATSTVHPNFGGELRAVQVNPFRHVHLPAALRYLSPIPLAFWPSSKMTNAVTEIASSETWDAVVAFQLPVARYAMIPSARGRLLDVDTSLSYMTVMRTLAARSATDRLRAQLSLYKTLRYEKRWAGQFDVCTVASPLELDYVEKMLSKSASALSVVPNGVDCDRNRPGLSIPQANSLIYNGSLTYSANLDAMSWFLRAVYPLIQSEVSTVSLSITGSTTGVNTDLLALDESTRLTGYVEDIRVPVAEAAVCVVPIRQGSGTRLKILEAMALGTPVVSTSKGAEGLDVVDGKHLLIADHPQSFANQVVMLLSDAQLRGKLSAEGRKLVEAKYDWRHIGEDFVGLLEETVDRQQAR